MVMVVMEDILDMVATEDMEAATVATEACHITGEIVVIFTCCRAITYLLYDIQARHVSKDLTRVKEVTHANLSIMCTFFQRLHRLHPSKLYGEDRYRIKYEEKCWANDSLRSSGSKCLSNWGRIVKTSQMIC